MWRGPGGAVGGIAHDFVCSFQNQQDAEIFYQQLDERLGKFGLAVSIPQENQDSVVQQVEAETKWKVRLFRV